MVRKQEGEVERKGEGGRREGDRAAEGETGKDRHGGVSERQEGLEGVNEFAGRWVSTHLLKGCGDRETGDTFRSYFCCDKSPKSLMIIYWAPKMYPESG